MNNLWWPSELKEGKESVESQTKSGTARITIDVLSDGDPNASEHELNVLEITSFSNREQCSVVSLKVKAGDIETWLQQPPSRPIQNGYQMRLALCPKSHIKPILSTMQLPVDYGSILSQHNARFFQVEGSERNGLVLHMRNPGFSFATTYASNSPISFGLLLGLSTDQLSSFVERLNGSDLTCFPPALVSICLLQEKVTWINHSSVICYNRLIATEEKIGTKTNHLLTEVPREPDWLARLDFDTIARDLTIISTAVARVDHQCLVGEQMINTVETAARSFLVASGNPDANSWLNSHLLTRISELHSFFHVLRLESQFYTRRTEANRQTVYSLIAKQDNVLNMQIARSSLADSNSMKVIATATARDSAAMVVISIVTIGFLPATFTATLFSTTFFNFQAQGQSVVSKWIWLYWAITAPLTIFIMGVWYFLSLHRGKIVQQRLNAGLNGMGTMSRATTSRNDTEMAEKETHQ